MTSNVFTHFVDLFDTKYAFGQLDSVIIPDIGRQMGGTISFLLFILCFLTSHEHWGTITYDIEVLEVNENSSRFDQVDVAKTICRQMSHQWIGNSVTCDWWDHIYLNEGLAQYYAYRCLNHFFPFWKVTISVVAQTSCGTLSSMKTLCLLL